MAGHSPSIHQPPHRMGIRLVLILILLAPAIVLFLLLGRHAFIAIYLYWLALMLTALFTWIWLRNSSKTDAGQVVPPPLPRMLPDVEQPSAVREVMDVSDALEKDHLRIFRGRLRTSADGAYEALKQAFGQEAVPVLRRDPRVGAVVVLVPKPTGAGAVERPVRPAIHWLLLFLTLLTTTWVGAAYQGVDLIRDPSRFAVGLAYSVPLLAILGIHELGHYLTARAHGMKVTPPYFIPVPFALGTFGAFIQMRSPPENRRTLFDVAVAGPLAGLAVAIPALWFGLKSSTLGAVNPAADSNSIGDGTFMTSSLLLNLIARWSLGLSEHAGPTAVRLGPMAFAGWLGLLVTALNLLPIGQLDGGHLARAMFGSRIGHGIGIASLWLLFFLALFVWPGLFLWALIVFFLAGGGYAPPLNDLSPISAGRHLLGWLAFVILFSILVPQSFLHRIATAGFPNL